MTLVVVAVLLVASAFVALVVGGVLKLMARRLPILRRNRLRRAIAAVVGVVTLVVGFAFSVGDLMSLSTSIPTFSSLQVHPDPSLRGTVAFNALPIAAQGKKLGCVDIVAASGGTVHRLFCAEQPMAMGAALTWLPDGQLEATNRGQDHWRKIIDVRSATVRDVAWTPPPAASATFRRGPAGQRIDVTSSRGVMRVTVIEGAQRRELLWVRVPPNYSIFSIAWSPDGHWFVAEDGAGRLLVITTDRHPTTRLLIDGASAPAVTNQTF